MADVTIHAPGRWGINTLDQNRPLHPNWAITADNVVLDSGRVLTGRGGLADVSTSAAADLVRIFAGFQTSGTSPAIVVSTASLLYTFSGGTLTSRIGSLTPSAGYWQFVALGGEILGWQRGETPIVRTSGNFADFSPGTGTAPAGDCALAAFGRVWATDTDHTTIKYCALGDTDDWSTGGGGGSIDTRNVWTLGPDYVTGIAAVGAKLVVFGRRHIIIYGDDGTGTEVGVDPAQLSVVDVIEGIGCVARDTIQEVDGDLIFLSDRGLESLQRVIVSGNNPLGSISWQINGELGATIRAKAQGLFFGQSAREFTGVYAPDYGWYFLIIDNTGVGNDSTVYVFHVTEKDQDEQGRPVVPITTWSSSSTAFNDMLHAAATADNHLYFIGDTEIYEYDPTDDDDPGGFEILIDYKSGWLVPDAESPSASYSVKSIEFVVGNPNDLAIEATVFWRTWGGTLGGLSILTPATRDPMIFLADTTESDGSMFTVQFRQNFGDSGYGASIQAVSATLKPLLTGVGRRG